MKRIIVQRGHHTARGLDKDIYLDYDDEMAKITQGHDAVPVEG